MCKRPLPGGKNREALAMSESQDRKSVAELAVELDADPKSIRHYLRTKFARSPESKGSRWGDAKAGMTLTKTQTAAVRERFTAKADEADAATA